MTSKTRLEFRRLVVAAIKELHPEFRARLRNVNIEIRNYPTSRQRGSSRLGKDMTLLGLYEGVPLTQEGFGVTMEPPARITIFQKPIEHICQSDKEVIEEVRRVVLHEIGHHFGLSDERLAELERGRREREGKGSADLSS